MKRSAIAVLAVVALGAGCSNSGPAAAPSPSSSAAPTSSSATAPADPNYSPGRHDVSFSVNGTNRTAVLVVPSDLSHPAPLVVAFHGHGGNGATFDRRMNIDSLWPDAIVVYPDGLPGHKGITDPDGSQPGWQVRPGDEGDRDLAFYDVMLSTLRSKLPVDDNRIFVMGHSNGSGFTALLWAARGGDIAAIATLSGQPAELEFNIAPVRSMFLMMGRTDPLVPFETQRQAIPRAQAKLAIDSSTATTDGYLTTAHGPNDIELDTYIHPAGHEVADAVPPLIVQFFQRHTKPTSG